MIATLTGAELRKLDGFAQAHAVDAPEQAENLHRLLAEYRKLRAEAKKAKPTE